MRIVVENEIISKCIKRLQKVERNTCFANKENIGNL